MLATAIRFAKFSQSLFGRGHFTPYLYGTAIAWGLVIPEGGSLLSTSDTRLAFKGESSVLAGALNTISICLSSSVDF